MKTLSKGISLWGLGVMLLLWNAPVFAKVIYVSRAGNDANDGSSWAKAKRSITAALNIAEPGDELWVRYGQYRERITLKDGVALYGGFQGTETDLAQRPPFPRPVGDPYETVLDGQLSGTVVTSPPTAQQPYRLDGFTIRNGNAENGGGIVCVGAGGDKLTVVDCTILANSASGSGGGVYCKNSRPAFLRCLILTNSARNGGGVFCDNASPTLTECTITQNSASDDGGGTYFAAGSSATVNACMISENVANGVGGGLLCDNASPGLAVCTINSNRAGSGGGVFCRGDNAAPSLTDCIISHNAAIATGDYAGGGGVYCVDNSSPVFENCTISHNTAGGAQNTRWGGGGGVYCRLTSRSILRRCIIAHNTHTSPARYGGGGDIYLNFSSPTLVDCVIDRNTTTLTGGAFTAITVLRLV